jgi:hypothetical protein
MWGRACRGLTPGMALELASQSLCSMERLISARSDCVVPNRTFGLDESVENVETATCQNFRHFARRGRTLGGFVPCRLEPNGGTSAGLQQSDAQDIVPRSASCILSPSP